MFFFTLNFRNKFKIVIFSRKTEIWQHCKSLTWLEKFWIWNQRTRIYKFNLISKRVYFSVFQYKIWLIKHKQISTWLPYVWDWHRVWSSNKLKKHSSFLISKSWNKDYLYFHSVNYIQTRVSGSKSSTLG